MEIHKDNFVASLPLLQKAIQECDFVAMDTEMTGLAAPSNIPKREDSLATRYSKVSVSAANFLVIQLGICTFTWSDSIGGYEARAFNLPCFPASTDDIKTERFFKCQSTSLEFLISNGFDFNKWISSGIPYLSRPEEDVYIARKAEKEAQLATISSSANNIPVDSRNKDFFETTIALIKDWFENSTEEALTVPAPNSFFRRLVHQIMRTDFGDHGLYVVSNSQARTMTVRRLTEEVRQEQEDAKKIQPPTLNLRRVLDMISDARKPLIGHNCFLDLMQISQQFLWELPLDLEEWKKAITREWNTVIDTKHLAGHPMITPLINVTALECISSSVQSAPFVTIGPKIVMSEGFDRYQLSAPKSDTETTTQGENTKSEENEPVKTNFHEAGYDAFMTGQVFLRLAGFILKEHERALADKEEHTRKKRRIEESGQEGTEDSTPSVAEQDGDASEEEEGELQETVEEKDALLEKRKNVIMDNPTASILESKELQGYFNLLHMMRSDIPVLNLLGPDQEPEDRPWSYLLKNIPSGFSTTTLFHLFGPYNPFRFNWVDDTSAWIQLSQYASAVNGEESSREPYELKPLPIGRLGEEYVSRFRVGDEESALKGREYGVVAAAADIEVVSWKTWYEEREAQERQHRELYVQRQQQQQQQQQFSPRELNGRFQKRPFRSGHSLVNAPSTPPQGSSGMSTPASPKVDGTQTVVPGQFTEGNSTTTDATAGATGSGLASGVSGDAITSESVAGNKRKHADEIEESS
ncbi:hypothetical protein BGZ50_005223 [Haplosporangium sp. Z 11]|nr:hypothetical protein BGZ50_005223 [Haplosporangium sp. Z 11]